MAISAVCPSCGATYNVPDEAAGKSVKCKKCSTAFTIPAKTAGAGDWYSLVASADADRTKAEELKKQKDEARKARSRPAPTLGGRPYPTPGTTVAAPPARRGEPLIDGETVGLAIVFAIIGVVLAVIAAIVSYISPNDVVSTIQVICGIYGLLLLVPGFMSLMIEVESGCLPVILFLCVPGWFIIAWVKRWDQHKAPALALIISWFVAFAIPIGGVIGAIKGHASEERAKAVKAAQAAPPPPPSAPWVEISQAPESLVQPLESNAPRWTPTVPKIDELGDEVRAGDFCFRPPRQWWYTFYSIPAVPHAWAPKGVLLAAKDAPKQGFQFMVLKKDVPSQVRRWVLTNPNARLTDEARVFTYMVDPTASESTGWLNDIPLQRVQVGNVGADPGFKGLCTVEYLILDGGENWTLIKYFGPPDDAASRAAFDASMLTLRRATRDDDGRLQFYMSEILERLEANDSIAISSARGAAWRDKLEAEVGEQLKTAPTRERVQALLALAEQHRLRIAPEALRAAAESKDDKIALLARRMLNATDTKNADHVAEALLGLKADAKPLEHLRSLATQTPDARRAEVIEAVKPFTRQGEPEVAEMAMLAWTHWADKTSLPDLRAVAFGAPPPPDAIRLTAIYACARLGDKPAISECVALLLKNDTRAADTLIAVGPSVERDVIRLLSDMPRLADKRQAIRVLGEVGTRMSLGPLNTAAGDSDALHATLAREAATAVKDRMRDAEKK